MTNKLEKIVEELSSLTLKEAADLSKMLEESWGVSAAAAMMPAMGNNAGGSNEEKEEESTSKKVELTSVGGQKIKVIKEYRGLFPEKALTDAKKEVESATDATPLLLKDNVDKDEAEKIAKSFKDVGAEVKIS